MVHGAVSMSFLLAPLAAQTTWIVNADGGPGVQFTTLAAAVAAAADGDTIVCQQPLFGTSLGGFTTSKGLTIVGDHNGVPLTTIATPIQILGLPAGRTFCMAGFQAVIDGELRIGVHNCLGRVELDNLQAREPDWFFPTTPAIDIANSASVVLRDVVDFGTPAVRVQSSRVVLTTCWLGMTRTDLGGGPCLWTDGAEVDIVQPNFRTGGLVQSPTAAWAAIASTNSVLRVAGLGTSLVSGGPPGSATGGSAIVANGGSVTIDPAVVLTSGVGSPLVTGTASFVTARVLATWTTVPARPGQLLVFATTAPAGAVWLALGVPGPLTATTLGSLGIDAGAGYAMFGVQTTSGLLPVMHLVPVPPSLPLGQAFAAQSLSWDGSSLQLGAPVTFVVQ